MFPERFGKEHVGLPVPSVAADPAPIARAARPGEPEIELIDDRQLLALLAGKTVALIGPPGRERWLVFDAPR